MKRKNIKYTKVAGMLLALTLTATSCSDLVDVQPRQSIDASTALTSKENVEASITSSYSTLKSLTLYGNRLVTLPEALSDNGTATNKSGRLLNESRNIRGFHFSQWFVAYSAINNINLTLEAIPILNVPGLTDAQKNDYIGQLLFLRALYHFDLVRTYAYIPQAVATGKDFGGVPYITVGTKTSEEAFALKPARTPIDDVYTNLYKDLDGAITNLAPLGTSGTAKARASKEAAQALYSRVALYRKDWAKAEEMASAVIATRGSTLLTSANYVSGWSQTYVPESIFEVAFTANTENIGVNESLQTSFTTLVARGNRSVQAGFGDLVPTTTLLADLGLTVAGNGTAAANITSRSTDVRNLLFEVGNTFRGTPFVECTKFIGKNGFVNLDNVPVFRVSEMYLNRAEARFNLTNELGAIADVNTIRTNRGLPLSVAAATALINEIYLQRRIEFAFEGYRFFDYKRRGLDIPKPSLGITIAFTDDVILPGIPTSEIDGNPNLKQNSGY